uniref:ATP-dependent DNA helicase n=1 Tax=Manihot esculenta TaxID=3983 RepID=A0A2C9UQ53_MANES
MAETKPKIKKEMKKRCGHLQSQHGKNIKNYDLPNIEEDQTHQSIKHSREITDEMVVEILEEVINAIQKLNIKQLHAYRIFLRRVDLNSSGVFFMDGLGGTGKTFLYHVLLVYVRSMGMIALAGATSGVAASIILGGRTTHSRFSILLSPTESSIVGNGEELEIKEGNIRIPEEMVAKYENENSCEEALIDAVYPSLEENARLAQYMTNRAILATKNEYVNSFNEKMINIFPSESNIYTSFDEAVDDANNYYQEKFLNTLLPNELSPHKLEFKMNCPIILLRNLDPSNGLCNGTIIVHISFKKNVIYAEIISRKHGKQVLLPRISLSPTENERYPFYFKIKQFLVRLYFTMTINEA